MKVYLSIGSNLGDKKANLDYAIRKIDDLAGKLIRSSTYYSSKSWGFESEHPFLNAVILIDTNFSPHKLLYVLKNIEKQMGRGKKTQNSNYQDRLIDIDILLYENLSINTPDLIIPHPLMNERDFVMTPLNEIIEDI